jgi:hypothetical protein
MKKAGLFLLVLVIWGGLVIKGSEAAQWCLQTDANQYFKLSVVKPDPLYPYWSLNGITYVPELVVIPVAGTMVKSADGSERLLTLSGGINGTVMEIDAVFDPETKTGTWNIIGISPPSAKETYTLEKVPCSSLPKP